MSEQINLFIVKTLNYKINMNFNNFDSFFPFSTYCTNAVTRTLMCRSHRSFTCLWSQQFDNSQFRKQKYGLQARFLLRPVNKFQIKNKPIGPRLQFRTPPLNLRYDDLIIYFSYVSLKGFSSTSNFDLNFPPGNCASAPGVQYIFLIKLSLHSN